MIFFLLTKGIRINYQFKRYFDKGTLKFQYDLTLNILTKKYYNKFRKRVSHY